MSRRRNGRDDTGVIKTALRELERTTVEGAAEIQRQCSESSEAAKKTTQELKRGRSNPPKTRPI